MTDQQVEGMKLFVDAGCVACHNGPALTDSNYYRFELPSSKDEGRFLVTGDEYDKFAFRTADAAERGCDLPVFQQRVCRQPA